MRAVVRSAGGGKTDELIRLCAKQGGYIVVLDKPTAYIVQDRAKTLELDITFPLTHHEFIQGQLHGRSSSPLWIDDADQLVARLTDARGAQLGGWSATGEDTTAEVERLKRSLDACVAVQEASRSNRENDRRQVGINHAKTTETMQEENQRLRQMVTVATDRITELDRQIVKLRKMIG